MVSTVEYWVNSHLITHRFLSDLDSATEKMGFLIFKFILGRVVDLPEKYATWILQGGTKNQKNALENQANHSKYAAVAKSNRITVWNYDKEGDLDNPISKALQWTEICDAIAVSDDEDEEKENMSNGKWLKAKNKYVR